MINYGSKKEELDTQYIRKYVVLFTCMVLLCLVLFGIVRYNEMQNQA